MAMAIAVTYGVLARYAFHRPSIYAMDLTKILMIPALVFSVSYVQRYRRHLQVDFISTRLPEKVQLIVLDVVVPLLALFVGFILVWKGWTSMAYSYSIHETSFSTWAEPLWPVKLSIPIGYALLCIVIIGQLIQAVAKLFGHATIAPGGSEVTAESERV